MSISNPFAVLFSATVAVVCAAALIVTWDEPATSRTVFLGACFVSNCISLAKHVD